MGLINFSLLNPFSISFRDNYNTPRQLNLRAEQQTHFQKHLLFKFLSEGKKFRHYDKAFTPVKDLSARKPLF